MRSRAASTWIAAGVLGRRSGARASRWPPGGLAPCRRLWRPQIGGMLPQVPATENFMEKQTLEQLEAALDAISKDLAPRVEELAQKSTEGLLTPEDQKEYAEVVRLNDMLSLLKLQAEQFWTMRAAS